MKKGNIILVAALCALALLPSFAFAQQTPSVVLAYFEDVSGALAVKNDKGVDVEPVEGLKLLKGWTLVTDKGDLAELKLDPNGTIIKISQKTNFKIDSLQGLGTDDRNGFSVAVGKFRTVAGKATGNEKYSFKGNSAVCGVRGTDFGMEVVPGKAETAFCLEGSVDYTKIGSNETILVAKGMFADAFASTFAAAAIPADMLKNIMQDIEFKKLSPTEVPGQTASAASGDSATAGKKDGDSGEKPPVPTQDDFMAGIMETLKKLIGLEIGSITIGDKTYSKAVAQPTIDLGKFKTALYLPLIYSGDMFNPNDWYKPAGNNEWSFGTQYLNAAKGGTDDWLSFAQDLASDVFLKIRYLEIGTIRDPFFLHFGNLNDMTVGHGLIMRDFANDADFPAIRRIGLNLGMDFTNFGFQAMVNDVSAAWPWDIMGGRFFLRPAAPAFNLAFGVSTVVDLNPTKDFPLTSGSTTYTAADVGKPIFINPGIDLDLPILPNNDLVNLVLFADASLLIPLLQTKPNQSVLAREAGIVLDAFWQPGQTIPVKNWGVAAGLFGNIAILKWRLEFRDYTGAFKPQFYNAGYERTRSQYVMELVDYLKNPTSTAYANQTMGIFGEGGFAIPKIGALSIAYFWPWGFENGKLVVDPEDRFVIKGSIEKGVIPVAGVKDMAATVTYQRTQLVTPWLRTPTPTRFDLVDANTVIKAEVTYSVAPTMDVALFYTTTAERNANGAVVYDTAATDTLSKYLPKMTSSVSVETRVHF